ncbi:MAG: polyprenyl synthetase family protein [Anaerolineales bacterium]|nr:polyprenyl synthetase family protein [Anaerolineales bacterium]MCW5854954.1 polyprenyl synthetase family protein [Anaerolineales bacterium]
MTTLTFQTQIQDLLLEVEARMRAQGDGYHPILKEALDQLLGSGGKRVRPTVVLLVSGMLGVDDYRSTSLAAAVELLHTATLVHDDLIDDSKLRRGQPTINSTLSTPATILTGDFLFSQSAGLGAQVGSPEVMHFFAQTLSTIVNGEIAQIFQRNALTDRDIYQERIYAKTASMFELAAKAPSVLVEGHRHHLEPLRAYGYGIGMAFQMVDDILDFSSSADDLGKPAASDLRLGLVTLPSLYWLEANPGDGRLATLQAGQRLPEAELDALVDDIRHSEAMQLANREAKQHVQDAKDMLEGLPDRPERDALLQLADYVVERLN